MNKFRFNINNALLFNKFWKSYKLKKIDYPEILHYLDKTYGAPVLVDNFHDLDNWQVKSQLEWGSATPDNLCTFVKENVKVQRNQNYNSLMIYTTPDQATGKGWEGEDIIRQISSGLVTSKFQISPGQVVSATVNTSRSYQGSWFSFWLFKKDVAGDNRYREIDIFEKFMKRKRQKKYSVSIHGGSKDSREMMIYSYRMFFVNEKKITFTCELHQHSIKIFVNGIQIFLSKEPDFDGEYYVMFNDGPSTHKGKVKEADIIKSLPKSFEIIDFRIYDLKNPGNE